MLKKQHVHKIHIPVKDRMSKTGDSIHDLTFELHDGVVEIYNQEGQGLVSVEVWAGQFRVNVWTKEALDNSRTPIIIPIHAVNKP